MKVSTWFVSGAVGIAAVLALGPALADDPMANTYANTVSTKNAKTGATGTLLFNADGNYTATGAGPDGKPLTYGGKWSLKDNGATLCLDPQLPPGTAGSPGSTCSPLSIHPVGEHWTVTNTAGDTFDVVMTAGR